MATVFSLPESGAGEQELQNLGTEGLQEAYFKDGGRRANDLLVEFTNIDYLDMCLTSLGERLDGPERTIDGFLTEQRSVNTTSVELLSGLVGKDTTE
jgi:hypothetical protein